MTTSGGPFHELTETLRTAVAALRDAGIPFLLGGSLAAWARGGPEPQNDLDLMVRPQDAQAAVQALEAIGMRPQAVPEEWLYKVWHGDVMVDVIFRPSGLELDDEVFSRGEMVAVLAIETPVMALEDVLSTKLHALREQCLDYTALLRIARAVREQIDWPRLRAQTSDSPYAAAFFTLVEELGVAPRPHGAGDGLDQTKPRVRVISNGS